MGVGRGGQSAFGGMVLGGQKTVKAKDEIPMVPEQLSDVDDGAYLTATCRPCTVHVLPR